MNKDQLLNLTLTDLSFKEILALFKRRRMVIIISTVILAAVGVLYAALSTPVYRSNVEILVEGRTQSNPVNSATNSVDALTMSSAQYDVMTQIQMMQSFWILYNALKEINYPIKDRMTQDEFDKLPKVTIQQLQTTNTVLVSCEYKDPQVAGDLAAAIPKVYQDEILDRQRSDVKRTFDFISARLDEEHKNMANLQDEYAVYKAENGVVNSQVELETRTSALSEAERQLAQAEAEVQSSAAAVKEAINQRNATPPTIKNPTMVTRLDMINRAEEQLYQLQEARNALLVNNLPDSDRVKRVDVQIESQQKIVDDLHNNRTTQNDMEVRNPIIDEMERTVAMSLAAQQGSIAKRDAMQKMVEQRKEDLKALAPITAKQQDYETRIAEVVASIQRLDQIQNDIRIRDNSLQSPIRNITGRTPAEYVKPVWPLIIGLSVLIGLVLGAVLALVRDVALDRVNSSTEASTIAEKEVLGRIPLRPSARSALIADPQKARAFEAYRLLRSSIFLAADGKKAFVVTSSVRREGKSTISGNLAVACALEGKKTILVDGNLRNPATHKLFKVEREKGLAEVLNGSLSLEEALKSTDTANLAVLTAGAEVPNPTELVASTAMKDLVEKLKGQADIVLIDAPAAFGYADAQSLVSIVSDVIFVTELESPTKTQMRESIGMIDFAKGAVLGLVVNKDTLAISRSKS